jgi:hypothetical protein
MMQDDDSQPKTDPSGNRPPPRPPNRTTVGLGPEDEDPKKKSKHESVRINLPAEQSVAPTITLPTLPTGQPPAPETVKPLKVSNTWRFVIALVALAIALPVSAVLTWMLLPFWDWMEASFGIESVGHSGPADWCYLVTLGLVIIATTGVWIVFRLKRSNQN